jgi:inosine-uridine nucleoside N-ribohydrolase
MAIAIDPSIATHVQRLHVAVETRGDLTRGETVVDYRGTSATPNVDVVIEASRDAFIAALRDALGG